MPNRDRPPFVARSRVETPASSYAASFGSARPEPTAPSLSDRGWRPELCEVVQRRGRSQTRHFMFGREGRFDVVLSYMSPRSELAEPQKANVA
jgi:hypothetical protein